LQAGVEGGDFFGGGFAAFEAAVGDVVACGRVVVVVEDYMLAFYGGTSSFLL
jgi:hypothetical protein